MRKYARGEVVSIMKIKARLGSVLARARFVRLQGRLIRELLYPSSRPRRLRGPDLPSE